MKTPFLNWLGENGRRFGMRSYSVSVIDDVVPGYHDCSVALEVAGRQFAGRGQARSQDVALSKAAGEAIERWLVASSASTSASTSNGFAVHPFLPAARANARREIVERDLFLCHMLTDTPFLPLPREAHRGHRALTAFARHLGRRGIDVKLGRLPSESGLVVVACGAFGAQCDVPFGVALGLGARGSLGGAITKAVLECWMSVMPVLYQGPPRSMSRARFSQHSASVDAHHEFAMHTEGAEALDALFAKRAPFTLHRTPHPHPIATTIWRELPAPFDTCPLFGVQATSALLQPLFFGLPSRARVNTARIVQFLEMRGLQQRAPRRDCIHLLS
jgi:hypothetical protein